MSDWPRSQKRGSRPRIDSGLASLTESGKAVRHDGNNPRAVLNLSGNIMVKPGDAMLREPTASDADVGPYTSFAAVHETTPLPRESGFIPIAG